MRLSRPLALAALVAALAGCSAADPPAASPTAAAPSAAAVSPRAGIEREPCQRAVSLIASATEVIDRFLRDPDLSTIELPELDALINQMTVLAPDLPPAVSTEFTKLIQPLEALRASKQTPDDITINTGVYADAGPKAIIGCGRAFPAATTVP